MFCLLAALIYLSGTNLNEYSFTRKEFFGSAMIYLLDWCHGPRRFKFMYQWHKWSHGHFDWNATSIEINEYS